MRSDRGVATNEYSESTVEIEAGGTAHEGDGGTATEEDGGTVTEGGKGIANGG